MGCGPGHWGALRADQGARIDERQVKGNGAGREIWADEHFTREAEFCLLVITEFSDSSVSPVAV